MTYQELFNAGDAITGKNLVPTFMGLIVWWRNQT